MTRELETQVRLAVAATAKNTFLSGKNSEATVGRAFALAELETGVEADQASRVFHLTDETISAGSDYTLDLYDFALNDMGTGLGRDPLGLELIMEEVVLLVVRKTGSGTLRVEPDATAGWSPFGDGVTLQAGEDILIRYKPGADALDVTDGTSHRLNFAASGADVVLEVLVVGRHDDEASSSSSSSSLSSSSTSTLSSTSSRSSFSSLSSSSTSSQSSSSSSSSSSSISSSSTSSESSSDSDSLSQ